MKYSVVTTTYNRAFLTKECISRAIQKAGMPFELIWVDDASPDGEVKDVMRKFCPTKTILREKNGGWAKAMNDGLRATTGDYIFLLDVDWVLPDDWLLVFDDYIKKIPETGGACMTWTGFMPNTHFRHMGWVGKLKKINGIEVATANKIMGFRCFSRRVFNKVGYIDDRLGWYGSTDTDWSNRALRTGEIFYYIPGYEVPHIEDDLNRKRKERWKKTNSARLAAKKDKSIYYSPFK